MIAIKDKYEEKETRVREELRKFINEGLEDVRAGRVYEFEDVARDLKARYGKSNA